MENLTTILKDTLTVYTGIGFRNYGFPVFDDAHQTYSVNVVDYATEIFEERAGIVFFVRIVGDKIVIEADFTDKPLYKALLNQGIPRDQIILAYAGEPSPPKQSRPIH